MAGSALLISSATSPRTRATDRPAGRHDGPARLEAAREWFAENRYQGYLCLHGLSVGMAEALAEYVHKRIRGELGFAAEEARDPDAMLAQGYRGSRYSFGYPACPNLADQQQLLALLRAEEIGITLSEEDQLDPEQSTSAIVLHHPQAKYFSVWGGGPRLPFFIKPATLSITCMQPQFPRNRQAKRRSRASPAD
jgi:Vitamin B12 dependent methionine synthase, activation domain